MPSRICRRSLTPTSHNPKHHQASHSTCRSVLSRNGAHPVYGLVTESPHQPERVPVMEETSEYPSRMWELMLRVYAQPGIAPACLRLQDVCGVDIPLFLAVLYAAASGADLNADGIRKLDHQCTEWRRTVVSPLRSIRIEMKSDPWMTLDARVSRLRENIKSLELAAERIEVDFLEEKLATLPPTKTPSISADTRTVARLFLECLSEAAASQANDDAMLIADAVSESIVDQ